MTLPVAEQSAWVCPFCPLACDDLTVRTGAAHERLQISGRDCERARVALRSQRSVLETSRAEVDGEPCDLPAAIDAAAALLAASRQPLFAGLGADVGGARALYRLACATGAICDAASGDTLMQGMRALQDRGQFTTTLAEVRTRADVIVFVGGLPGDAAPLLAQRCGMDAESATQRRVILLGPGETDLAQLEECASPGVTLEALALERDLYTTLGLLAALSAGRPVPAAPEALRVLVQRLRDARYGVLVGALARWPAHSALLVEAVHRIVGELNRTTRAAALWVGGGNGAATANQVFTWLSGLPLRSRAGPRGLEHEPLVFGARRLLDDRAVDCLLWASAFDAQALPPSAKLPLILLGHPALGAACRRPGAVFIPVATPGVGCDGHVFRTDGTVLMPLHAISSLISAARPSLADVAQRISRSLAARKAL